MDSPSLSSHHLWSRAAALILFLLMVVVGLPADTRAQPSGDSDVQACQAEQAELNDVRTRIDVHNAQPHLFTLPQQQAQANAYDAEAGALNSEQTADAARLAACRATKAQLADGQPVRQFTPRVITLVDDAKKKVPNGYVPPSPPPVQPGKQATAVTPELRPLFTVLRDNSPPSNIPRWVLQGEQKGSIGDPDPSMHPTGNGVILPRPKFPNIPWVDADHLVPLARILYIPGFLQLSAENMLAVVNAPLNLQWLSGPANLSKQSRSACVLLNCDPTWVAMQVALEDALLVQLEQIIRELVANQGGS
ncbi:hypothetical protein ABZ319_04500 [Nocardia sp. NPDC005978]|uniref:hypothetical protein n=1 Tax=Nocardia sp. NPDC005978 TaxID=3156725 RepID=UPI0033A60417